MVYLFGIIVAFYITVVLIPPLSGVARHFSLVDVPDSRKIHLSVIPRVGGIGIITGAVMTYFIWGWLTEYRLTTEFKACFAGVLVLFVTGVLDDFFTLDYKKKLFGQCLAAAIAILPGKLLIANLGFWNGASEVILPYGAALPLTFVFIVGITNAINLSDGLDGLAGGLSVFIFSALAIISYIEGRNDLLVACLSIIGALLAFLRYNSFPAKIFMGDAGSLFLGFVAAIISISLTQSQNSPIARTLPLLILGLPIMDTLFVIVYRILSGESPFKADRKHFHYQFMSIGFSHAYAVLWMYFFQALMLFSSINLRYYSEPGIVILFGILFLFLLVLFFAAKKSNVLFSGGPKRVADIFDADSNAFFRVLKKGAFAYVGIIMPIGVIGLSIISAPLDASVLWVISFLFGLSLTLLAIHRMYHEYAFRVTIYLLVAALLLNTQQISILPFGFPLKTMHVWFWGSIAFSVALFHLLSRFMYLKDTTLDYIVILMVLLVPVFPQEIIAGWHLPMVVGGMLVFFWSSDLLLNTRGKFFAWFPVCCYLAMGIAILRVVNG